MKALVTGGTGLIGRQVVKLLCDDGVDVTSVSLDRLVVDKRADHIVGDLCDFRYCLHITEGYDEVYHIAGVKGSAQVTKTKPASFFVPLLMMNTNVLEACRRNNVARVVYTSSIGAYSSAEVFKESFELSDMPPMDTYPGWAKRMAELQIKAYAIQYGLSNFAVVRPCNVYGPGDNFDPDNAMVIPSLIRRIYNKENPLTVWGDGTAIRDFAYSEDVAQGIILACRQGTYGSYINLGSGRSYTIKKLVETLQSFLHFEYVFDTTKPSGFPKRVMDISLAQGLLGYAPQVSLREGLERTWKWFVDHSTEYTSRKNYFKE